MPGPSLRFLSMIHSCGLSICLSFSIICLILCIEVSLPNNLWLTLIKPLVFAGKDASRALAMSSVKPEDVVAEWEDLSDKEKTVLEEWMTFFSKRYNIVGKVVQ